MPGGVVPFVAQRRGEFVVLLACLPGSPEQPAGLLLVDPESGKGYLRLRRQLDHLDEDTEFWDALPDDLESKLREQGAAPFLSWMEDTLSNSLRLTERREVSVDSFTRVLDRLFGEHVEPVPIERFQTHLPLYTLRAAAGYLGEQVQPEEANPEEWVPLPTWRKPSTRLFAARIEGRSMEPLIPDGSVNLFSSDLQGSRGGKVVLVERFDVSDPSQRYSVKRYTSRKNFHGDEWAHGDVTFVPHNHEYEPWSPQPGEFRILAEWLGVIE